MKNIAIIILLITLVLTGCSAKDKTTTNNSQQFLTESEAIAKAKKVIGIDFPEKQGEVQGTISAGGPVTTKLSAKLKTEVEQIDKNQFTITFTETWDAKDFKNSNDNKTTLSHYFKYKVSMDKVESIGSGGDFPPQGMK